MKQRPGFLIELTDPLRPNARFICHNWIDARHKISGHVPDEARLARRLYLGLLHFQTIRIAMRFAGRGAPASRQQIEEKLRQVAAEEAHNALMEAAELDRLAANDRGNANAA